MFTVHILIQRALSTVKSVNLSMQYRSENSVVRLSVAKFAVPSICPNVKSRHIKLESFGDSLHLSAPALSRRKFPQETWYSGIPMSIKIRVKNAGFQKVHDAFVSILLKQKREDGSSDPTIFKSRSQNFQLEPQKKTRYIVQYTPTVPGKFDVYASCFFRYDDHCVTTIQHKLNVVSPIVLKWSFISPFLYCDIENTSALTLNNVRLSIPGGETKQVTTRLAPREAETVFVEVNEEQKTVAIEWSLPFCDNCRQTYMPGHKDKKAEEFPIDVTVRDTPKLVATLEPFRVSLVLRNRMDMSLSGGMQICGNESIIVHGNPHITFEPIAADEERIYQVEFVALNEGDFLLPSLMFEFNEIPSKCTIKLEDGILVVGCRH